MVFDASAPGQLSQPGDGVRLSDTGRQVSRLDFVLASTERLALPVWFLILSLDRVQTFVMRDQAGIDLRLYRDAAIVALSGDNPWRTFPAGGFLAAPPPTLLFYLPSALVPLPVATVAAMIIGIGSGLWIVRRLGLPWWWLAAPPLVASIVVGNPDASVLALVLAAGPVAGLGAALKVYAAIPLLAQRRWRALAVTVGVFALSLPLWPAYLGSLDTVRDRSRPRPAR